VWGGIAARVLSKLLREIASNEELLGGKGLGCAIRMHHATISRSLGRVNFFSPSAEHMAYAASA